MLGRVLDDDGVGGRQEGQTAGVEHQPEHVHRLFGIGVAQVERPDDLFLVLAALRRCVGNDDDRLRRVDAEERPRRARDGVQCVVERGVPQVDRDRGLAKLRIEDDADAAEARDGREHIPAAGVAKDERARHLDVRWQIETGRRQIARPVDEALKLRLAFTRDGDFRAELVAGGSQFLVDSGVGRAQFGGHAIFHDGFVELPDGRQPASSLQVIFGRPRLGAFEAGAGAAAVGIQAKRLRVFDDGAVVVAAEFGVAAVSRGRGRGAGRREGGRDGESGKERGVSALHR